MSTVLPPIAIEAPDIKVVKPGVWKRLMRNPSVLIGGALLYMMGLILMAVSGSPAGSVAPRIAKPRVPGLTAIPSW